MIFLLEFKKSKTFKNNLILLFFLLFLFENSFANSDIDFNTDFIIDDGLENVDFSKFSKSNYIQPGEYALDLYVNKDLVSEEQEILFFTPDYDQDSSIPCITPSIYNNLGLKSETKKKASWLLNGQCLDVNSIPSLSFKSDLGKNKIELIMPQAFIEYREKNWDPPSSWDDGLSGVFIDYNIIGRAVKNQQKRDKNTDYTTSSTGTVGVNLGSWRLRADWQYQNKNSGKDEKSWYWNQIYAYTSIRDLNSRLTLGEQYLSSDLFNSIHYLGSSLETNELMLPPRLQGYSPVVSGVAKSTATVIIKQKERIIYQTEVSPGPFRIDDIGFWGGGVLDVYVYEQDGETNHFTVETSGLSTLTAPGQIIYKAAIGKPISENHNTQGPVFTMGSLSWGINNNISLYGGIIGSNEYQNIALGIGSDIFPFGVFSAYINSSRAKIRDNRSLTGKSYRLTYTKNFDSINSQITFSNYKFFEKNYMEMDEFIGARYNDNLVRNSKNAHTITFGTKAPFNTNVYLNYSYQNYWDEKSTNRYNLTLSNSFSIGKIERIYSNVTFYKTKNHQNNDSGLYVNFSIPLDDHKANISYSQSSSKGYKSYNTTYSSKIDERGDYTVSVGTTNKEKLNVRGKYNYNSDIVQLTLNGAHIQNKQNSLSLQLKGGLTATGKGGSLHMNTSSRNGSRILIDTDGVKDIPIRYKGKVVRTNNNGQAVFSNASNFRRTNVDISVNDMPDNAEISGSSKSIVLTEGAIGYRKFKIIKGHKILTEIHLETNEYPPFGASVINEKNVEVGIVSDNGFSYLIGINPSDTLKVIWGDEKICHIQIPKTIEDSIEKLVSLSCK